MRATSYRENTRLRAAMQRAMRRDGYTRRQKSRWVCRAIEKLLDEDPALVTVGLGEDLEAYPLQSVIGIDKAAQEAIDRAYWIVRGQDAMAEGIQTSVIRAAIRHGVKYGIPLAEAA